MGNGQQGTTSEQVHRIVSINRPDLKAKLNVMVDYIKCYDPLDINLDGESVTLQIYSSLTNQTRYEELTVQNKHIGLQLKPETLPKQPIPQFRITKIFRNSPLSKYNIKEGQYIVGLLGYTYRNAKQFSFLLSRILETVAREIGLGVWNAHEAESRLVVIQTEDLREWAQQRMTKGMLGCELAEGWMHNCLSASRNSLIEKQFETQEQIQEKSTEKVNKLEQISKNEKDEQEIVEKQKQFVEQKLEVGMHEEKQSFSKQEQPISQEQHQNESESIEQMPQVHYCTFCTCSPKNPDCQQCFLETENAYIFYNKRFRKNYKLDRNLLLPINL